MAETKPLTGYPSIDKPWLKYYSEEEMNVIIPEGSMFDYLYKRNAAYPDDIAIEYYGHSFSYQELFYLIDSCCRSLSAIGVKKGDIITVQAVSVPQVIVLIYAITRIGACGNMLYPDAKAEDVVRSMEKTGSRLFIVIDKLLSTYEMDLPDSFNYPIILLNVADQMGIIPRLFASKKASYKQKNSKLHVITWKSFICSKGAPYQENHDGTIPAFMLCTGGTTGIPKEVVLNSRGFNAVAESIFYHGISDGYKRQDTTLLLLPPFIAFGIGTGIHHPLAFGARLVVSIDVSPAAVANLVTKNKPKYLSAGVVQMEQLVKDLENKQLDLSFLKLLWVGGEAMNQGLEEKLCFFLKKHGCSAIPLNGYGLTETTAGVTAETMAVHKMGSAGTPFAFCNMKIVDPDTYEELTYDQQGEICLASPGIMLEYYKNPQATNEIIEFKDGERWLHTGDIGSISVDGLLTITGRIKRIIVCKVGNLYHKVFPLLVENELMQVPGVQEISIVGRFDEIAGNVLVAYVVPEIVEEWQKTAEALKNYSYTNLQAFERPVDYVCIESLPRTLIGKVDYRKLEEMAKGK